MKTYIAAILTLILVILLGILVILYKNSGFNINFSKNRDVSTSDNKETFVTKNDEQTNGEVNKELLTGTIKGKICYPSEGIPPLTLYFQEKDTQDVIELKTETNQSEYEINDVPIGTYTAFAYVNGVESDGGGYTQAVECGLTTDCTDHTLIEFNVLENETTMDINLCDWYGAEIPERP